MTSDPTDGVSANGSTNGHRPTSDGPPAEAGGAPAWPEEVWDPAYDDPAERRRRRPRARRVVAAIVALALLAATLGGLIGELVGGGSGGSLETSVLGVSAGPGTSSEQVTFVVDNATSGPATVTCTVVVRRGATVVGQTTAHSGRSLPEGAAVQASVDVAVSVPGFAGSPGDATVTC